MRSSSLTLVPDSREQPPKGHETAKRPSHPLTASEGRSPPSSPFVGDRRLEWVEWYEVGFLIFGGCCGCCLIWNGMGLDVPPRASVGDCV
ncbi:hypothetical protein V6N11_021813 [Hibiscus sabdariffa]|uniref:Uncharacterized protein n=1 Tax=Hibiscus sabdariffa TaxID=183260 RepID=A0ABR2TI08_9ROSI